VCFCLTNNNNLKDSKCLNSAEMFVLNKDGLLKERYRIQSFAVNIVLDSTGDELQGRSLYFISNVHVQYRGQA
jgi:hypothetical protein